MWDIDIHDITLFDQKGPLPGIKGAMVNAIAVEISRAEPSLPGYSFGIAFLDLPVSVGKSPEVENIDISDVLLLSPFRPGSPQKTAVVRFQGSIWDLANSCSKQIEREEALNCLESHVSSNLVPK